MDPGRMKMMKAEVLKKSKAVSCGRWSSKIPLPNILPWKLRMSSEMAMENKFEAELFETGNFKELNAGFSGMFDSHKVGPPR